MEYFMLLATDAEDVHEARMAARPAHLARLEELKAQGRLLTAGPNPLPDNPERVSGSLIVAQFELWTLPKNGLNKTLTSMPAYTQKY